MKTPEEIIWESAFYKATDLILMGCKNDVSKIVQRALKECREAKEGQIQSKIRRNKSLDRIELDIFSGFGPNAQLMIDIHEAQKKGNRIKLIRHHSGDSPDPTRGGLKADYFTLEADE